MCFMEKKYESEKLPSVILMLRSSMSINQCYILNKVSLNVNVQKIMLCIDKVIKMWQKAFRSITLCFL